MIPIVFSLLSTALLFSAHGALAPQFSSIQPQTNREVLLKLAGVATNSYEIESSADGISWRPFVTLRGAATNQHLDSAAPFMIRRFFRAQEVASNAITGDHIATTNGDVVVHVVNHASFAMTWNGITIYNDPVGGSSLYRDLPRANLILISHDHSDHRDAATLTAVLAPQGAIVAPQAVYNLLSTTLKAATIVLTNNTSTNMLGLQVEAVPAYNSNHPRGSGNGYILTVGGKRFYMSGDTGAQPEIAALKNIDVAFLCMNVPFTMTVTQAATLARQFQPAILYPYHYRNQDGTQADLNSLKRLIGTDLGIEVRTRKWY